MYEFFTTYLLLVSVYHDDMFYRYYLDTIPYTISINDVNLYEDQLQMNINNYRSLIINTVLAIP